MTMTKIQTYSEAVEGIKSIVSSYKNAKVFPTHTAEQLVKISHDNYVVRDYFENYIGFHLPTKDACGLIKEIQDLVMEENDEFITILAIRAQFEYENSNLETARELLERAASIGELKLVELLTRSLNEGLPPSIIHKMHAEWYATNKTRIENMGNQSLKESYEVIGVSIEVKPIELYETPIVIDHMYGVVQKDLSPMISVVEVDGKEEKEFIGPEASQDAKTWSLRKINKIMDTM